MNKQQQVAVERQLLRACASQRLSTGDPTTMKLTPTNYHHNLYNRIPPINNSDVQAGQIYGYATSDLSSSAAVGEPQDYSSDYHYYQVVVPSQTTTTNHRMLSMSPPVEPHHQTNLCPSHETPTLQANLINSEPLITSCSWQNKTLINLNNQMSGNYYYGPALHNSDQPRYAPFSPTPIELARIQQYNPSAYCNQNSLLSRHLAHKRATHTSNERSFSSKRLPFGFLSTRLFLLLLLLAASSALFLLALLSNKLPVVNKVYETGAAGPISPNEPHMHRQLMGLPTLGPSGPPMLAQSPYSNLTPPSGHSFPATTSIHQFEPNRMNTPTPTPRATTQLGSLPLQPTSPTYVQLLALSYWDQSGNDAGSQCNPSSQRACNLQGLCINRICRCFAGYSGPTCARADCPEDCSQRGICELRPDKPINQLIAASLFDSESSSIQHIHARTSSIAFSSLTSARYSSSMCPHSVMDNSSHHSNFVDVTETSQPRTYDHRLEWHCSCRAGFAGPKCERLEELDCANNRDDDHDGLVDCDDDDCCSQPVCSQIFVCYTSPEPQLVLEQLAATSGSWWPTVDNKQQQLSLKASDLTVNGEAFYSQMRFLIANKSMQSYVHESAFEASRVAVIRGRVVKWSTPEGIVSVRVAVVENERLGFTLTRHDGSFDLLVNGNEWITLELHKNAYTPLKHRIYVHPLTINQLDQELVMWLASSSGSSSSVTQHQQTSRTDFGASVIAELHQLAWSATTKDDPRRTNLLQCLLNVARSPQNTNLHQEMGQVRPWFINGVNPDTDFVLVSGGVSYKTSIELPMPSPIEFAYNSAMFPPAASLVKSHLVVQLLEQQKPLPSSLTSILVHFDVEGQMKSERLQPIVGLTYQFAWNRRNVYEQKVYGFAQLIVRIGYEYSSSNTTHALYLDCLAGHQMGSSAGNDWAKSESFLANLNRRTVWFERRLHLEAHQLNHHADLAKWQLPTYNRFDSDRQLIYFESGWSLPFRSAYPPVVSVPLPLFPLDTAHRASGTQSMTHGPPDTMFMILQGRLIQLDVSGGWQAMHQTARRLIDVPLATLSTKLSIQNPKTPPELGDDDLQLIYNNHQSMLYVSSRSAAKIVQVSLLSLLVLNKTQAGQSPTSAPEDEIDIEPLCGFGRHSLSMEGEPVRLARSVRLTGPHDLTLDEQNQILYFIDGTSSLMALELQTRRLTFIPALVPQPNSRQDFKSPDNCDHLRIQWTLFSLIKPSSLKWVRSLSALVFIDQNTVFALGQDMLVQVLATGSGSAYQAFEGCAKQLKLGEIKLLLVDDTTDNLFVVHQWQAPQNSYSGKLNGRFYLAKLKLGITQSSSHIRPVVDIHSAHSAWDPTIKQLAKAGNKTTINWDEISLSPAQLIAKHRSAISQQMNSTGQLTTTSTSTTTTATRTKIPFIHLQDGFDRIDSIEINSDGSIFVLDSNANSIRMIAAYSPNNFNLIERHDVNINRLFVTNQESSQYYSSLYAQSSRQPFYYGNHTKTANLDETETHKLNVLIIQNPISDEMLEFHSTSGLQLASFTPKHPTYNDQEDNFSTKKTNRRLEFYYKITSASRMVEDDANDFQAIKLTQNYKLLELYNSNQQQSKRSNMELSNHFNPSCVRLNKILDIDNGNVYELQRLEKNSGLVLQSILLNDQLICELTSDFMGVLTTIQLLHQDFKSELVYDGTVYLLREMATKSIQQLQSTIHSSDSAEYDVQTSTKTRRQLKKIAYDNLFYHHCDLIIANL